MSKYETVEVPFIKRGNHQILTEKQLRELPWLREFVERFSNCFEKDPVTYSYIYYPEGVAETSDAR